MTLFWKVVLGVLAGATLLYLAAVAWLWKNQRRFIYPRPAVVGTGTPMDPAMRDIQLTTADGVALRAIYQPSRSGKPTIVFFHGNGDSLGGSQQATRLLAARGYGLLLPEYRGYGGNAGTPSEVGLYRDGRAALGWLASQGIPAEQMILIGNSLGSGIATELASTNSVGALVIVSGFTSLPDAVQAVVPYVPARWLISDQYDNRRKLHRVECPVLILHGSDDTLIDADQAQSLAHARPSATLRLLPGFGHELAYTDAGQAAIAAWLHRIGR